MGKRKTSRTVPPVVAVMREGPPSPAQQAAYRRLWDMLLAPKEEKAPAPGMDDRGDKEESP